MKLRPLQVVGVVAVLVFGGILTFTLTKERRDPDRLPSGVRLSDLPSPSQLTNPAPPPELKTHTPQELMAIGSQEAKDDLYCQGVLYAEHRAHPPASIKDSVAQTDAVLALASAGVSKLKDEAEAAGMITGAIADAHADQAQSDYDAGKLRLSVRDCEARAAALPAQAPL